MKGTDHNASGSSRAGSEDHGTTVWTEDALRDPHHDAEKSEKVRRMFAAIARSYDLNNRLHAFGRDQAWRRHAVRATEAGAGDRVLDVACGTGDLSEAFARAGVAEVIGVDYTPEMLELARAKAARGRGGVQRIDYRQGDATALEFDSESFDVVSIAFGIRNVTDPEAALREFFRVLRPGGRLVILEFAEPRNPLIGWMNRIYTERVMPVTATLIARDRSGAYRYLPKSVKSFLSRDELAAAMSRAGFESVRTQELTFGVCASHVGYKQGRVRAESPLTG